ncbi:MAG: M1 family metallopeptidase [Ignavibacteriales bacterium]|nr:M1 family metallopeptidase [Ignavibacteriales bacterium]
MKRTIGTILLILFWYSVGVSRQIIFPSPLSPCIANYDIAVTLDTQKKMLHGKETLVWRNKSLDKIKELQFHLYINGFKNTESTFMKESRQRDGEVEGIPWGWIDVKKMVIRNGEDLTNKMRYIHPDDDNDQDQTVISVPLTKPVRRGKIITIDLEFEVQLPMIYARTGYKDNFFMVAQWFPKIGVYEAAGDRYATKGSWNCHQFHAETEFFSDYGVYNVEITVPQNYIVGAVGVLQQELKNSDSTKTLKFRAEDVHDFSWSASPDFTVIEDQWRSVHIRLLTQKYKVGSISERYIQSMKVALQHLNDWAGTYPYPNVTIVDPPLMAEKAGGMEYPTLITGLSIWGLPKKIRMVEVVTIHEFGHQYFYGLLGSNEFEEAWLDEGFTQYFETRIMDAAYGEKTSFVDIFGLRIGDFEFSRWGYIDMRNNKIAPTLQPAWQYRAGGYGSLTYMKSAALLVTLERMVSRPVMDEIMHTYFERWKFKHPCTRDFIAVVNEIVPKHHGEKFGKDMNWYFDQVLSGTDVCDYELTSIAVNEIHHSTGIFDVEGKKTNIHRQRGEKPDSLFRSVVLVSRLGEVKMPVDVLIRFDDGKDVRETWDGQVRWKQYIYSGKSKVVSATVDPDNILVLDINMNNNSRTVQPSSIPFWKYTTKFMTLVQAILQSTLLF